MTAFLEEDGVYVLCQVWEASYEIAPTCNVIPPIGLLVTFSHSQLEQSIGLAVLTKLYVPILAGAIFVGDSNITITGGKALRGDLSGNKRKDIARRPSLLILSERLIKTSAPSHFRIQ